jgi:putative transcriptional regulator
MRFLLILVVSTLFWAAPAAAADDVSDTFILVAKRQLRDRFYGATILVARPVDNDEHIGFIVNRPTKITLSQLFPGHAPSKKVLDPVYLGGPVNSASIFALVQTRRNPGGHSVQLMTDLYAVLDGSRVDQVIEKDPSKARFVAGLVAWRSGELRDEIKRGAWHLLDADVSLVLRKQTAGMWEELVHRAELRANSI